MILTIDRMVLALHLGLFAAVLREVAAEQERVTLDGASASKNFPYLSREVAADQVHLALVFFQ
jgi:hypothetical protein